MNELCCHLAVNQQQTEKAEFSHSRPDAKGGGGESNGLSHYGLRYAALVHSSDNVASSDHCGEKKEQEHGAAKNSFRASPLPLGDSLTDVSYLQSQVHVITMHDSQCQPYLGA